MTQIVRIYVCQYNVGICIYCIRVGGVSTARECYRRSRYHLSGVCVTVVVIIIDIRHRGGIISINIRISCIVIIVIDWLLQNVINTFGSGQPLKVRYQIDEFCIVDVVEP